MTTAPVGGLVMDDDGRLDDREVHALLRAPVTLEQLPSGVWRAAKGGHVGVGPTREAAAAELGRKLWKAISKPRL